jgi:tRNA 2-(methylsulfanyl)-N6-isopentenyladenosine37 hydroxylase
MLELRVPTPRAWLAAVLADFDAFMLDHALCERKASAMGMSLVAKYPDRSLILEPLIEFAREELEHFQIMYRLIAARGLVLPPDARDPYINGLRSSLEPSGNLLLDRLLMAGIIEARGCERLIMVADALEDGALKRTYLELSRAEARHHSLFLRLARQYFDDRAVRGRLIPLLDREAEIMRSLPLGPRVH